MDYKKNLTFGLSCVARMYIVISALLSNALACLYGNQTSDFFELDAPALQEYIN